MNTPSAPFENARRTNDRSTLPVHMSRMIFMSGAYCSLETPAKSAAEYPHQLHKNPTILGLKVIPESISVSPPRNTHHDVHADSSRGHSYERRKSRVDLAEHLFVGVVLEDDGPGGALGVAETVSLAQHWIDLGPLPERRVVPLDGPVGAGRYAGAARDAIPVVHFAHRARRGDGVPREQGDGAA